MHQLESTWHELRLVALQVSYQMPADARVAQGFLFLQRFLNSILANVRKTSRDRGANRVGPESLRHGDNRYWLRCQPRNDGPHLRQMLGEGLETHSL
jgi:hypothetical protein